MTRAEALLVTAHRCGRRRRRAPRGAGRRLTSSAAGFEVRVLAEEAEPTWTCPRSPVRPGRGRRASSWSSCSAATAPSCAAAELARPARRAAARREPRPGRLPRRGRAGRPGRTVATWSPRRTPVEERLTARRRGPSTTASSSPGRGRSTRPAWRRQPGSGCSSCMVDVDGRPLSRWGCDGVVCATPTGSTAYAFSAGGPVVWPEVEALLLVPISAHALFSRPLVVAPTSTLSDRGGPVHGRGGAVVRRPAHRRPAAGRPDRGAPG